ncbi:GGDEF domain-containing protein [Nitrincola iocasae]|uniref:diguanylate cyclase n=1 Tax=Nitrincola iocasae TaxID=2614693 RepID=A0A5J6L9U9_9GAMM|nr:sensor domain-containing diguanylate cyclase [Nitrincola iocasae]QEW05148.1 GGDEF domain-containing protein [Nitrincola iocasae]
MSLNPEQMLAVLNALPDPVFVLTETGRYAGVYGHADPNYYHSGHDLVGAYLADVLSADVAEWVMQHMQLAWDKGGLVKVEYPLSAAQVKGLESQAGPDGVIWFEGHIQPFPRRVEGERAVIWVARSITRRKLLEKELLEASQTDPLTRVANRRPLFDLLQSRFSEFQRYHHPTSLILFDLDHFKQVNDRFGHLMGDQVLTTLCDICQQTLRDNDLLARFGGEEFIVVLPNTVMEQALHLAERMREVVFRELSACFPQYERAITISLGVSEFLISDPQFESLLQRADTALYQAKHAGRNRVKACLQ